MRVWLLALLLLAAGCARPAAHAHDTLRIVQTQDFPSLNPIFVSGIGGQELSALAFSYLVKIDDRGRLVADAAERVPTRSNGGISPDGITITYRLRPDLRFSDGLPVTSADVASTIRSVSDERTDAPTRAGYEVVRSVRTPDARTVVVRLSRPFSPVLLYLCAPGGGVPILPVHVLHGAVRFTGLHFGDDPVGSGPYRVAEWRRGELLRLERNPFYVPQPGIARLEIRFVPSSTTALEMVRSGEVDAYVNADDTQYEELRRIRGMRVSEDPLDAIGALIFNTADPAVGEAPIRHAIAASIDARSLVDKTLQGPQRDRDPGRGLFLWAYTPSAFPTPSYDPGFAGASLRARHPALTLIVRADKPSATTMATEIQSALATEGVQVTIRRYPVTELVAPDGPLYSGRFSLALFTFIAGYDPDVSDQFRCDRIPPHGFNKSRYCNPELDQVLERGAATYDRSERFAAYRRAQQILARDLPLDPLYQAVTIDAFPADLHGQTDAVDTPFWNVAAWRW